MNSATQQKQTNKAATPYNIYYNSKSRKIKRDKCHLLKPTDKLCVKPENLQCRIDWKDLSESNSCRIIHLFNPKIYLTILQMIIQI